MNRTQLLNKFYFKQRQKAQSKYANYAEQFQMKVLRRLVNKAADTMWGAEHDYGKIKEYSDFARNVDVNTYEELKSYIHKMRGGESDILWPGQIHWFAKSSGTTNDKSKFIPVTYEGLKKIHYAGGRDCISNYLALFPESNLFNGKSLMLGGSHAPNLNTPDSLVGDLSAIMIENIPRAMELIRIPSKKVALLDDFEQKRDLIARVAMEKNVTNISGVPSWMLSVLNRMLEISGEKTLDNIWPNLEVFFHGGVAFGPYREQYKKIITHDNMHYMETYNASEGFFGIQTDLSDPAMTLTWNGIAESYKIWAGIADMSTGVVTLNVVGETTDMTFTIDNIGTEAGYYVFVVQSVTGECESDLNEELANNNYVLYQYDLVPENEIVSAIYPNPTSGDVNIKAEAMKHISVYNAMGQMVYDQDVDTDEMILNMGQYESGVYMVNIITENGSSVKRITVTK